MPREQTTTLLWGIAEDDPLALVRDALEQRGAAYFFLDQREILNVEVELTVNGSIDGLIRIGERSCELATLRAVYLRCYDSSRLPNVARARDDAARRHARAVDQTLTAWLELTSALVVNPYAAMASNNSKPYQLGLIRAAGFEVPETLLTTDARAARAFWDRHGSVIYKSISGVRSIVSRLTTADAERLNDLRWCPTQFQEYVPGHDYRVHVVGDAMFACEIESNTDDYRYAAQKGGYVEFRPCELPQSCAERCRKLAADLGLALAGIDLRQTPDGRWYCFEVNPSPGFSYYEAATSQPIANAVANLLTGK